MQVVIATDDPLLRAVTSRAFATADDVTVRIVADLDSLVSAARRTARTIVLASGTLADRPVHPVIPELLAQGCRTLLLVDEPDDPTVTDGLLAGAAGSICTRDCDTDELVDAVRTIERGGAVLHAHATAEVLRQWRRLARADDYGLRDRPAVHALTRREEQILDAVGHGLTATAIGRRLGISARTVETHKRRIFAKLGAADQAHAVAIAARRGLLTG